MVYLGFMQVSQMHFIYLFSNRSEKYFIFKQIQQTVESIINLNLNTEI